MVKSIQRGTYTAEFGDNSKPAQLTISITPVDINKAILIVNLTNGYNSYDNANVIEYVRLKEDKIVIDGSAGWTSKTSMNLTWQVVEFY